MEYLSLYDYLGKAAGPELGKEVSAEAKKHKIKIKTKEILNPNYEGIVQMYPKDFLDFYFREPYPIHIEDLPEGHDWTGNLDDDDLPF